PRGVRVPGSAGDRHPHTTRRPRTTKAATPQRPDGPAVRLGPSATVIAAASGPWAARARRRP
ncbi:hypothetical protein, partial [Streptomyces griseus]|uniref:hypothetical protein n=1 Tax=Streptomyces griseus TaxID=1911 RepID=UPI001C59A8E2